LPNCSTSSIKGFWIWLDCPVEPARNKKGGPSFAAYLLEEAKVALVPVVAFGADKYARLSYAVSMENIKKGMDRIEEAIKNLK